jgi:hypothetical protein
MDIVSYYGDLAKIEADLKDKFKDRVVYVTSLFHRERNSTAGAVLSATPHNAARVITDGTHRLSTKEEIEDFLQHQQEELERSTISEQAKKKQYIVVVDQKVGSAAEVFEPRTIRQQTSSSE